jgi:hypothetical protein
MKAMKIWLVEYAVLHHHPFMVKHLDENKLYILGWFVLEKGRMAVG